MNRVRHLRMYDLHSWTGLAIGLLIYIVVFTGCVALFHAELESWEDPAKRLSVASSPVAINTAVADWVDEKAADGEVSFLGVYGPTVHNPYFYAFMNVTEAEGETNSHEVRWNTSTGAVLPKRGDGLVHWLVQFHTDLMWPTALGGRIVGRTLVGIIGIALLLSIVSGVIIHTKIREEFFSLRYLRSVRLKWQDTLKILGLWLLPFYGMISFTGAFLGVLALLVPIVAVLAFKGDQEALIEAVLGPQEEATGVAAQMLSIDTAFSITHPRTDIEPRIILVENWGDEAATYDLLYEAQTELALYDTATVSGVTGEVIKDSSTNTLSRGGRTTYSIAPLHYGTFGGIWLKGFYFVLGLSLAVVTATGLMMWTERRLHGNEGQRTAKFYQRLSRANVGVIMGLPIASAVIFYLDKVYAGPEGARLAWTGWVYFIAWFAVLGYAIRQVNEYKSVRQLMALLGALLVGIPFTNIAATGDLFLLSLGSGTDWAWADLIFLLSGILTVFIARTLPAKRPEKKSKKRRAAKQEAEPSVPPHAAPAE